MSRFTLSSPPAPTPTLFIAVVFSLVALFGQASPAQTAPKLSTSIEMVVKQKIRAEGMVELLGESYKDGETPKKDYQKGKRLYIDARAAYNAWITKLQFELELNHTKGSSEEYDISLRDAAAKAENFITYADKLVFGDSSGAAPGAYSAAIQLLDTFTRLGHSIWKEWRKSTKERRERLMNKLETLKWKSFSSALR